MGVVALGHTALGAFAPPDVSLPTDVLNALRLVFEAQWPRSADLRGRAGRPGAFAQNASGLGVAGFRHPPLLAPLARGICCRDQTQEWHLCAWVGEARQVTHGRHHGDGHGERHPTQGLEGVNPGRHTPRFAVLSECLCQTPEALGVLMDGTDVCLQDDWLRRGGTDDCREPTEGGWAPIGPARRADILPAQAGVETARGVFESADRIFACPREITKSFLVHCGDLP